MKKERLVKTVDLLDENRQAAEDIGEQQSMSIKKRLVIGIGAALLILALAVALPSLLEAVTPPAETQAETTSQQPQVPAIAADSELTVNAYGPGWKETALQPNVVVALNAYSPTQSDVPGLPFIISVGSEKINPDSIRVDVNTGSLVTWGPPDYSVKQRGSTYVLSSGDTIYWSPLDDAGAAVPQCEMTVTAFDSSNNAYAVSIKISETEELNYTAEIK